MVATQSTRKPLHSRNFRVLPVRPPSPPHPPKPDPLRLELFHLIRKLQLTLAVVTAAVKALQMQAAEQDEDIALVLQRHVGDALSHEVEKWEALLQAQGEPRRPKAH